MVDPLLPLDPHPVKFLRLTEDEVYQRNVRKMVVHEREKATRLHPNMGTDEQFIKLEKIEDNHLEQLRVPTPNSAPNSASKLLKRIFF